MALTLDVKADVRKAMNKLGASKKAVELATVRALNRTISEVKTQTVNDLKREIGEAAGVSVAGFRKSIQEAKATRARLEASLTPSGRALPLMAFKARQVASGVSAAAWGKRKVYKGAFIAKMPSGHKGVFRRTGKKRLPIKELWGPALPKEFTKLKIAGAMKRIARTAWPKHWERELNYYQGKYGS